MNEYVLVQYFFGKKNNNVMSDKNKQQGFVNILNCYA